MLGGPHLDNPATQRGPECTGLSCPFRSSARGGREHADATFEQVGSGVCRALSFRASQRVSTHEDRRGSRVAFDHLDDLSLGAARIGHQRVTRRQLGHATHVLGDPADGRADDHDLGGGHAIGQIGRSAVDGTQPAGLVERRRVAADTDHLGRKFPGAERQADRSSDQPDADKCHGPRKLQCSTLSMPRNRIRRTTQFGDREMP